MPRSTTADHSRGNWLYTPEERERLAQWHADQRRANDEDWGVSGGTYFRSDARDAELASLRAQDSALKTQLSATHLSASHMDQTRRENVTIVRKDAQLHKWNLKYAGRKGESLFSFLESVCTTGFVRIVTSGFHRAYI